MPPLKVGDKVPFCPNDEREWRKAEVMTRSYMLEDECKRGYRINRRQIISLPNDSPMTPRTRAPPISKARERTLGTRLANLLEQKKAFT